MENVLSFVQAHKPYFEVAQAVSSVVNLFAWLLALLLLVIALRKSRVESLSVGPFSFRMMKEEAIIATATASRAWQSTSGEKVDVPLIRATVDRVFTPETFNNLTGKAILWVDDNPANNELAVRALRKFGLDIEQATNTEAAMVAFQRRKFDLVISDMGRGDDIRAGYRLLKLVRDSGSGVPFFIFAGSDTLEFRREAAERGAQLSTNDMLELVDHVVKYLGSNS
ncbi:response regulator [Hyphomicrobium sp. xq]|uniref:Response regulator n=1 Tax=Hyphomicrobium album TaxID=2665159 RepID=A0A6I3KJK1_9HYPH|nr:response regulator [Hyphomicrobium album]MTD93912.1 response regulator [Hyphomicrobium album]